MRVAKVCTTAGMLMCLLALAVPGHADTFIKQVTNTDAVEMMGQKQPATSDTGTAWYAADKACMINADGNTTVYRADKGVMYMVDHNKKAYAEVPLTWLKDAMAGAVAEAEAEAENPEMAEAMKMMGGMMKFNVTVTPTEETKKIRDWDATKYIVEIDMGMGKVKSDTWAAPSLEVDVTAFMAMSNAMMAMFEGFDSGIEEMKKIKGMPVLSTSEMMMMGTVLKGSTELLEFSEKDAPAGIYDIPEGYEKTDMPNPMAR